MNTLWALILPNAVPVFSVVLLLAFFRGLPKELEESTFLDGAGHMTLAFCIYVPLSLPALATLKMIVINQDITTSAVLNDALLKQISNETYKAAQIVLGALPILLVYLFLQFFLSKASSSAA